MSDGPASNRIQQPGQHPPPGDYPSAGSAQPYGAGPPLSYSGNPPPGYRPPVKRKMWPWVLISLGVVVILIGAGTIVFFLGASASRDKPSASSDDSPIATVAPPVTGVPTRESGQPRTLEAATAAEQENADRYSSGDYAGQWLLYSGRLRDAISQDDYVAFAKRCAQEKDLIEGLPFTVDGVRMDGDNKAIVRIELFGVKQSRTMVYEDGQWLQEPTDELAANFGKPVDQWVC